MCLEYVILSRYNRTKVRQEEYNNNRSTRQQDFGCDRLHGSRTFREFLIKIKQIFRSSSIREFDSSLCLSFDLQGGGSTSLRARCIFCHYPFSGGAPNDETSVDSKLRVACFVPHFPIPSPGFSSLRERQNTIKIMAALSIGLFVTSCDCGRVCAQRELL